MTHVAAKTAEKLKTPRKSKKKLLLTCTGAAVLLIAIVITAVILSGRVTPPDPGQNPADAKKFMAGKDFGRMSKQEKLAYIAKFGNERDLFRPGDDNLTDAERAQLRENMRALFEARMRERLNKFFAATKEEQNKMLDEDIRHDAERDKQRQNSGGPGGPDGGPPPEGRGGTPPSPPGAQEQRNREASSNPTTHAQMQVYMTMKQQRKNAQL